MQITRRNLFAVAAVVGAGLTASKSIVLPAMAAAPAAGKQNAGWYRYKVGDFEVTVVTDGMNTNPLSDAYVSNAPKADVNAALDALFLAKDKVAHAYTPVVINTGSKLVAIDTGLGLGMFEQSKGAVGQYHANLQAAGIDRNAVDVVIISHFHGDHINGLVGPDNKPAFPNAEVMVPEAEWAFWADESNVSKLPDVAKSQMPNPKRVFGVLGNKVTKYQGSKELVPGITLSQPPAIRPVTCRTRLHQGAEDSGAIRRYCRRRVAVRTQSGLAIRVRHGQAAGGRDAEKSLRYGRKRENDGAGLSHRVPIHGVCGEKRKRLPVGAGTVEFVDLVQPVHQG